MKKKGWFKDMWQDVKIIAFILIAWAILNLLLPLESYFGKITVSIIGWVINITAFGYVGYSAMKNKKKISYAIKEGAYLGIIIGLVSAILGIIAIYIFPERTQEVIQTAIAQGIDPESVKLFIKVGAFANLFFIPLFSAILGALFTAVPALIFRKKK